MIVTTLLLAAALAEPAVDQTSLFFECKMSSPATAEQHDLGFVYFEPRIAGAYPLNFKDPDHLLPSLTDATPTPINMWPTALVVAFPRSKSESGRPGTAMLVEPSTEAGTAFAKIGGLRDGKWVADSYTGTCTYMDGAAAEQKFRNLLKQ